ELNAYSRTVAHDINSSLSTIVGLSDALNDTFEDLDKEIIVEYLSRISESARKLSIVVKEILLLTQIEKESIKVEAVDMEHIIEEVKKRLEQQINNLNATIRIDQRLIPCKGYPAWIEELVYNLLDNAIKYGGRPPVVEFSSEKIRGNKIQYNIRDNGSGISNVNIQELIKGNDSIRDAKGHGIGLSIVKMILKKLNGELTAKKIPGNGTVFSFSFPE
ncbi:MAG: hypothetical protein K8R53_09065, partial [Bacteroidales bacterium]|nr:hypothetical protein [Bacteroidales bacterium]